MDSDNIKYYKLLGENGAAIFGGNGNWYLPKENGEPGDWMPPVEGPVRLCSNGYHLIPKTKIIDWYRGASVLYEAEGRGDFDNGGIINDKVAFREARLIKMIFSPETIRQEQIKFQDPRLTEWESITGDTTLKSIIDDRLKRNVFISSVNTVINVLKGRISELNFEQYLTLKSNLIPKWDPKVTDPDQIGSLLHSLCYERDNYREIIRAIINKL